MSYPIDTIFLDARGQVLAVFTLRPWRFSRFFWRAAGALEMRAGEAARLGIEKGVRIRLVETETS